MSPPTCERPPPDAVELALVTLAYAIGALLWTVPGMVSLLTPPPVGVAVVALVVAGFLWWHAPPGHGSAAREQRTRFRTGRWVRGHARVAALTVTMIPFQLSLLVVMMALGWTSGGEQGSFFDDYLKRPWGWTVIWALAVGAAPVIEEVFFRGRIQRMLERQMGPAPAIAVTAAVFALSHFHLSGVPDFFASGVVLGVAVFATRSVWAGVVMHATWNAVALAISAADLDFDPAGRGIVWALPFLLVLALSAAATAWVARGLLAECRGGRPRGRPALERHAAVVPPVVTTG